MDYDDFISLVEQTIGTDRETAERAAQATLATLGEHLGRDVCRQLVPQLPPALGGWLFSEGAAQGFEVTEFLRRIAERERTDTATAERHARAVLMALGRALTDDAYAHMVSRLSNDYVPLLPKGPTAGGAASLSAFLGGVSARAGVDTDTARRITDVVLQTLGERIGPGEVDDLLTQLPVGLHTALKRGAFAANDRTRSLSADEFLNRIAERLGIPPDTPGLPPARAREYTRAVFNTLRQTVREEFFDVTDQLPNEYWDLVARRT
ncbi:DUF2267 domain-containing protein [Planosporangium mesophilum]|uniref:DUF2267 domain-containing protein n=1 Tax=Planosporangium mesophilum TaxID=689768 RepID=A0A8J3X0A8_9ACTN|nr:DUF2267 domain-containing protein [Planosporangium mesophilum]NJC84266.1 DUF2267 domain-containing protein [Planosporangium mesophilum]GII23107.1 hypothetical protein Pme01_27040 [Planosporangium mesophilum]